MKSILFEGPNSGSQVAINNGVVNNEFHSDLSAKLPIVHEATFDSFEDQHEPECHPGTRTDLLRQIEDWAQLSRSAGSKCIFWLNGMAGTGKSTISRTVARRFHDANSLGASFFFKRNVGGRGTANGLVATIACQLARNIPGMMPLIKQATQENENIATKRMEEQFKKLILDPLLSLQPHSLPSHQTARTIVIVIDALDECEDEGNIQLILRLLPRLQQSTVVQLRVFLTSRPELEIRAGFSKILNRRDFILHQIPNEVVEHDLSLFLHHRLSEIGTKRSLASDWIEDSTIQELVLLSRPLFIFAATVCRMLEDPRFDPVETLAQSLASGKKLSHLDNTYIPVLNRLASGLRDTNQTRHLVEEFQKIVGAIIILRDPLSVVSLSQLIDVPEVRIRMRLDLLHSVLSVPNDTNLPVRLFHLSFRDFLVDHETREKTDFWIDPNKAHLNMTSSCISICRKYLRKNICELPTDATPRGALDRTTINRYMPLEFQYACRYWAHHLAQCITQPGSRYGSGGPDVIDDAYSFLEKHFLHWVEAMSILGIVSDLVGIIDALLYHVMSIEGPQILSFLSYGKQFVLKNAQIIDAAPLQIYCAALIFAPHDAFRKMIECDLPSWIDHLPQVDTNWSLKLHSFDTGSDPIRAVVFSPDGRHLASLSQSIQVRNFPTGTIQCVLEFEGDSSSSRVLRLEFSSNSRLLGSMSSNEIRVWDPTTGNLRLKLDVGHPDTRFKWFSFSPDSHTIACVSLGGFLRIFDSATGVLRHAMDIDPFASDKTEFSSDGRLLVSLYKSGRMTLRDLKEEKPDRVLESDSGYISSFTISPDGHLLACGIENGDVDIFELSTGHLKTSLFCGLTRISAVVFSPDSRLLASVSVCAIQIWDTLTEELRYAFNADSIFQTIFSLDSSLLVAARTDGKISIFSCTGSSWEHDGDILSQACTVALLPDPVAPVLAFGSNRGTLRLWDLAHRTVNRKYAEMVKMNLSPDGRLLASRSGGEFTIWDTVTGVKKQELKSDISRDYDSMELPVAFSHDNRLVALICPPGEGNEGILIWSVATGILKKTIQLPDLNFAIFSDPEKQKYMSFRFEEGVLAFYGERISGFLNTSVPILWDSKIGVWDHISSYVGHQKRRWLMGGEGKHPKRASRIQSTLNLVNLKRLGRSGKSLDPGGNGMSVMRRKTDATISLVSDQWIALNDERVLWLPPEFRHGRPTILVDGTMVALAHMSGNVLFLRFSI